MMWCGVKLLLLCGVGQWGVVRCSAYSIVCRCMISCFHTPHTRAHTCRTRRSRGPARRHGLRYVNAHTHKACASSNWDQTYHSLARLHIHYTVHAHEPTGGGGQGGFGQPPPLDNCGPNGSQMSSGALLISFIASLCVCGLCVFVCGFYRWVSAKKQFKYGKLSQEDDDEQYLEYEDTGSRPKAKDEAVHQH